MIGMFDTIAIILAAMCFGGILDVTGMMAQFAEKILAIAKRRIGSGYRINVPDHQCDLL